jgi:hypothetical protein
MLGNLFFFFVTTCSITGRCTDHGGEYRFHFESFLSSTLKILQRFPPEQCYTLSSPLPTQGFVSPKTKVIKFVLI